LVRAPSLQHATVEGRGFKSHCRLLTIGVWLAPGVLPPACKQRANGRRYCSLAPKATGILMPILRDVACDMTSDFTILINHFLSEYNRGTVLKLGTERHQSKLLKGIDTLEDVGCFGLTELGYGRQN
jgi:alkylation response protein AidB-like acyl-CoA dehydrogenase